VTPDGGERDPDSDSEPFGALRDDGGDDDGLDVEPGDALDIDDDLADDHSSSALPPKVEAWRKRSATGAMLTGFALGLQQVFEKKKEEPAIVMQTSGDPPTDLPVEADVEHGRPRQSVVSIRPWLLPDRDGRAGEGEATEIGQADRPDEPGEDGAAGPPDAARAAEPSAEAAEAPRPDTRSEDT
jgi:hypothetical protein